MKVDIFNTDKKYNIIYADPPWQYRSKECLAKKSILNGELNVHYPTMTLDEIKQLPIPKIAEKDSLLFLWVVSPMLDDCMEVLKSWGYRYATIGFVWDKQKPNPGSYTMSQCEVCLIGKKGKIPTPRGIRNARQFLSEKKEKHSSKPDEIRNRIMAMFPDNSKIELFAREAAEGWDCWGNEAPEDFTEIMQKLP